ncbi:hypothetical protein GCM10008066_16490 [Oxalicibacterium faecigallinarum]|uniref:tRNA (guanine(46)-N(7))-methyltransferase n=2 Tax=Oxalicibacterium faecigallinarum TaxID=573741 RepID=A0A8J3AS95_9BURK|nr:hypothetical protein GCM10008066_16490 [Oxalicibacterium faecigallinarum]
MQAFLFFTLHDRAMHANSSPIVSSQTGIHEQLPTLVARHATHTFQKPVASYNQRSFDQNIGIWKKAGSKPLILDTGCGVGLSTLHLATQFPDHFVIGIDQSEDRITRNTQWPQAVPENFICVRADLVDYWRLMLAHGIFPARQYLLYPNPWPKIGHLSRRWHGHPVFPTIVALGGLIECRSNWALYVEEFAAAVTQLSGQDVQAERYIPTHTITPFEAKYLASGHALWRCMATLPPKI